LRFQLVSGYFLIMLSWPRIYCWNFSQREIFLQDGIAVTCLIMFEIRNINSNRMKRRT